MDYFGDASGHLKGLLTGNCDIYVAAVVGGDKMACRRCPKRAVRRVDDLEEAKWKDLLDKQKRRLIECFADNDYLEFGYAAFTRKQLQSLQLSHLLYQDAEFPPAWDLALEGWAYGEILFEMDAPEEQRMTFTFDRVASQPQSEAVSEHVEDFIATIDPYMVESKGSKAVQAADCLAGAVAEDKTSDANWLDSINDDRIVECSASALVQLEAQLSEYNSEP